MISVYVRGLGGTLHKHWYCTLDSLNASVLMHVLDSLKNSYKPHNHLDGGQRKLLWYLHECDRQNLSYELLPMQWYLGIKIETFKVEPLTDLPGTVTVSMEEFSNALCLFSLQLELGTL